MMNRQKDRQKAQNQKWLLPMRLSKKMSRLKVRKLIALAITLSTGAMLVNIVYVRYMTVKKEDFQIEAVERLDALINRNERLEWSSQVRMIINKSTNATGNLNQPDHLSPKPTKTIQNWSRNLSLETIKRMADFSHTEENNLQSNRFVDKQSNSSTKRILEKSNNSTSENPLEKKTILTAEKPLEESQNTNTSVNEIEKKKSKATKGKAETTSNVSKKEPVDKENANDFDESVLNNEIMHFVSNDTLVAKDSVCPEKSPYLVGALAGMFENVTKEKLIEEFPYLETCGRLRPSECAPRQKIAFIFPYRNRYRHLHITVYNLIPILKRQLADVTLFVVEQAPPSTFNKGALLNAAFLEAEKLGNFDCYIFHDVDLIPLNDKNLYKCESNPRHYAVAIDKYDFELYYQSHFGGVVGFSKENYLKVNGNSNLYLGWGGEDDDFRARLVSKGYNILRYPLEIARYNMIKHTRDNGNEVNPLRRVILKSSNKRQDIEGLNTVKYKVLNITCEPLYTWITVSINNTEILLTAPQSTLKDVQEAKRKWQSEMERKRKEANVTRS
uniref:Galactosyltransferase N-terminal domain-containing protein n=2 Tax=Biomphalaria glabrata TaxID=6526 RepID=A0A2C9JF46_BIOGL